jgi:hypothetical protein
MIRAFLCSVAVLLAAAGGAPEPAFQLRPAADLLSSAILAGA